MSSLSSPSCLSKLIRQAAFRYIPMFSAGHGCWIHKYGGPGSPPGHLLGEEMRIGGLRWKFLEAESFHGCSRECTSHSRGAHQLQQVTSPQILLTGRSSIRRLFDVLKHMIYHDASSIKYDPSSTKHSVFCHHTYPAKNLN